MFFEGVFSDHVVLNRSTITPKTLIFNFLTFHVIQIGAGQHLGLGLVGGHLLVDGRLHGRHAADADPLPQVIVASLGARQPVVDGLPAEPAAGRGGTRWI